MTWFVIKKKKIIESEDGICGKLKVCDCVFFFLNSDKKVKTGLKELVNRLDLVDCKILIQITANNDSIYTGYTLLLHFHRCGLSQSTCVEVKQCTESHR